jgi:hypothetical protein
VIEGNVESLQSHCIHTQFNWSSGPPVCFLSWGTQVQSPGGYLSENRILLLALSRYIGDPDIIDHCGLVWGGLRPILSRSVTRSSCWQCDNPTWSHTALLSQFHAHCGSSFRLRNLHSRLLGGSPVETLLSHCILTQLHWSSGPHVCSLSWGIRVQSPGGYLCGTGILLLVLSRYRNII